MFSLVITVEFIKITLLIFNLIHNSKQFIGMHYDQVVISMHSFCHLNNTVKLADKLIDVNMSTYGLIYWTG